MYVCNVSIRWAYARNMKLLTLLAAIGVTSVPPQSAIVYVGGQPLAERAVIIGGRTYLPVRAIAEELGASVDYNARQRTVTINRQQRPTLEDLVGFTIRNGQDPLENIITSSNAEFLARRIGLRADVTEALGRQLIQHCVEWEENIYDIWLSFTLFSNYETCIWAGAAEGDDASWADLRTLGLHCLTLSMWHQRP